MAGLFQSIARVASDTHALHDVPHSVLRDRFARISKMRVRTDATVTQDSHATEYERKQVRVVQLISAYRQRGHQQAQLDPLALAQRPSGLKATETSMPSFGSDLEPGMADSRDVGCARHDARSPQRFVSNAAEGHA